MYIIFRTWLWHIFVYINFNFLHTVFQNCNDMHLFYVDVTSYVTHFENVVGPNDHHPCGALYTVGSLDFLLHGVATLVSNRPGIPCCNACFYCIPAQMAVASSGSSISVAMCPRDLMEGRARWMDMREGGGEQSQQSRGGGWNEDTSRR